MELLILLAILLPIICVGLPIFIVYIVRDVKTINKYKTPKKHAEKVVESNNLVSTESIKPVVSQPKSSALNNVQNAQKNIKNFKKILLLAID